MKTLSCALVAITLGAASARADLREVFEVEAFDVGRLTSGPPTTTEIDPRASAREWVRFVAARPGDWVQFTLPGLYAGRFALKLRHALPADAAPCVVEIGEADGSDRRTVGHLGPSPEPARLHPSGHVFRLSQLEQVALERPGFKTLRFTARSAGVIGIDMVAVSPQSDQRLAPPDNLRIITSGPVHMELAWTGTDESGAGVLIERRGPPSQGWRLVGHAPAKATRFVSAGLRPNTQYEHRVLRYSDRGLGRASDAVTARTPEGWANARGRTIQTSGARAGEGSVVKLRDGRLLMYYNVQPKVGDFTAFDLFQTESSDGGLTWTEGRPFLRDPGGTTGFMMPSLLRLDNAAIALVYAQRSQADLSAHRFCRISTDDAQSWSEPVKITTDLPLIADGRTFTGATGPHDRLVQLANGDLLIPFHLTTGFADKDNDPCNDRAGHLLVCATVVYRSPDRGRTWQRVFGPVTLKGTAQAIPYPHHWHDQVLMEPALVEHAPGQLLLHMRNQSGFFYQARSTDGGLAWSPVEQSPIAAPISPAKLLAIEPGVIAVVFNPWVDPSESNLGRRFALGSMISRDGGLTWENFKILDMIDPARGPSLLCYPYFFRDGATLHAFYFGPRGMTMAHQRLPGTWLTDP